MAHKFYTNDVVYFQVNFNLDDGGYVFNKRLTFTHEINEYKGRPLLFATSNECYYVKTVTKYDDKKSVVLGIYTLYLSSKYDNYAPCPMETCLTLYLNNGTLLKDVIVRTLTETEFELYKRLTRDCFHESILKNIVDLNKHRER